MTWEELKEKAKEMGYEYIKERGVAQLYKNCGSCVINFMEPSGNVVVDVPFPSVIHSGILCEHVTVDKMYQIMLALR